MSKKFSMVRNVDATGVSGTGEILEGVVFENGKVAAAWLPSSEVKAASIVIFDSMDDFMSVHVFSHPENQTQLIWEDDHPDVPRI